MLWRLDAGYSDIVFNGPKATRATSHMADLADTRAVTPRPHGPSAGGARQSPHIPQGKGDPIGRISTQTRHSGFDTSSVASVSVCMAHDEEKSSRSVMRSLLPCVGRANARDPHTKDKVEEATGDGGRGSLMDGPSSRVAVTRDHASLPPVS